MKCSILSKFYGRDTRAVLVGSIAINGILLLAVMSNFFGFLDFSLPKSLEPEPISFIYIAIASIVVGALAPISKGYRKQMFKSFTFLSSTVVQVIFANGYVTDYPPLSLMLLVSSALALWYLGAAVYVLRCEGLDGDYTTVD